MNPDRLARLASRVRCPACRVANLALLPGALACANCARRYPDRGGFYDLLESPPQAPTLGQRWFLTHAGARLYAALREGPLLTLTNLHGFAWERRFLTDALALRDDAAALDVPCGQGNFTQVIARAVSSGGVIGVDLSDRMLKLARARLDAEGIRNVLLLRASALDLPLEDGAVDGVSSCGGLHLYPDVPRAIAEMRRVLPPGAPVAGLTFRSHQGVAFAALARALRTAGVVAFDFDDLGDEFARAGFADWRWEGRALIAWFRARAGD